MLALPTGSAVSWLLQIAHVRYIKILTRLRGFRNTIANFSRLHCLAIPRRELSTKKAQPNIKKNDQKASDSCLNCNITNVAGYSGSQGAPTPKRSRLRSVVQRGEPVGDKEGELRRKNEPLLQRGVWGRGRVDYS